EPNLNVDGLAVANDCDADRFTGTVFLDLGQEFLDGAYSFVFDGDDQVGGVRVEGLADEAGQWLLDFHSDRLDTRPLGGPRFHDFDDEQSFARGIDPGDSQVGPDHT